MSIASVIGRILGHRADASRPSWREAIHASRNEATKAIAQARMATKAADASSERLGATIQQQEQAKLDVDTAELKKIEAAFLRRLRGEE